MVQPPYVSIAISVVAGIIVLTAFWFYNRHDNKINVGTWFILFYGDSLELGSYFEMTGEWWKNIVPACLAIGSFGTFGYALIRRRFSRVDWFDVFIIAMDVAITAIWYFAYTTDTVVEVATREWNAATFANLLYQCSTLITFIPMWRKQLIGEEQEWALPWLLWAFAFLLQFIAVAPEQHAIEELAYPIVGLFTHYMIGVTSLDLRMLRQARDIA